MCIRDRLYIVIGTAVVYLFSQMSGNALLYSALRFDRTSILQGQVWRLITYPLTYSAGNVLLTAITLLCYYSLGRAMENVWGTLRFNLFYLTGVVMMDVYCLIFGGQASVTYLKDVYKRQERRSHRFLNMQCAPGSDEPGAYFIFSQLRPATVLRRRRWASASPLWG